MSPILGVVIVTFNASDVIHSCLESLMAARNVDLRVVVVDNSSSDNTVECIRSWAKGESSLTRPSHLPFALGKLSKPVPLFETDGSDGPYRRNGVTLLHAGVNGGFAAGVNRGLEFLAQDTEVMRFWILNPDCVVPPNTPRAFAEHPEPEAGFALMGGRINYLSPSDKVQSDGGIIRALTGATANLNRGKLADVTQPPNSDEIDFVCGASMVASRQFYETVGSMSEQYFLYYEEVDWALRRDNLPLLWCDSAIVYHHVGSSIGSGYLSKKSTAFSVYFLYRSHILFVRKHFPSRLPFAYLWGIGKLLQLLLGGRINQAYALLCAINGLHPPKEILERLGSNTGLPPLSGPATAD